AHLLPELVDALAEVVQRLERLRAAGQVGELAQRLLPAVGEPRQHVLVLLSLGHARNPRGWTGRQRMRTGVPVGTRSQSRSTTSFATRMQPCETALPSRSASFVPWIAIGPPCAQSWRTGEKAEMPSAAGPKGPSGSGATSFWFT